MKRIRVVVLLLQAVLVVQAAKRFQDGMQQRRPGSASVGHPKLHGWSPDSNWDEKRYPAWRDGDSRWENCWRGGKVEAHLTSDSPALVGSDVTFAVTLQFPRCQKEDENGDIVYEDSEKCRNGSSLLAGGSVYNWTEWLADCDEDDCYNNSAGHFPEGRPFPDHDRRRKFIYVFHTLGHSFHRTGGSSALLSLNTTNITVGTQMMEVVVYRRGKHRHFIPVAKASGIYIITDEIPFFVDISQKTDRNATDHTFIKDSPITFTVEIHDPSHYLNASAISYNWSFGDGSGSLVSNNPLILHTYTLKGNFSLKLTIKAALPGPCEPVTPTAPILTTNAPIPTTFTTNTTSADTADLMEDLNQGTARHSTTTRHSTTAMSTTPAMECVLYRYGYYSSNITTVEGILEVTVLQMTRVQVSAAQADSIDFVVACKGSIPTDGCTVISDSTCTVPFDTECDPVAATTDQCLLTLRRSFSEPGTYCVNISLSDDASMALASTLVSVKGGSGSARTMQKVLLPIGFMVVLATVLTVFLYKRSREYKPIAGPGGRVPREGVSVQFTNLKAVSTGSIEKTPLLKGNDGTI